MLLETTLLRTGPRERLAMHGHAVLSDAELVAVLLGTGARAQPAPLIAARLLEQAGTLRALGRSSYAQLRAQNGVGATKACRLLAAFELGRRALCRPLEHGRALLCSRDVDAALRPRFVDETREHFLAIALDVKNQPLAELSIAIGGLTACAISPADVFRQVLRVAAVSVIFVHNHPSGDPTPSEADIAITERLFRAGELLGVHVVDHVVLGAEESFSFADAGLLPASQGSVWVP